MWIPYLVAFFYSTRPSESQPLYWVIVATIEVVFWFWFVKSIAKKRFVVPGLVNWAFLGLQILLFAPVAIRKPYLSAADNQDSLVLGIATILTLIPICLFTDFKLKSRASEQGTQ